MNGDLHPRRGKWVTEAPDTCGNGHTLGAGDVLVGHQACLGHRGGHTTWSCARCHLTTYGPPTGAACTILDGPARQRLEFGPTD